jgi:hypothetical protein
MHSLTMSTEVAESDKFTDWIGVIYSLHEDVVLRDRLKCILFGTSKPPKSGFQIVSGPPVRGIAVDATAEKFNGRGKHDICRVESRFNEMISI